LNHGATKELPLGAHVSIAGGMFKAFERGDRLQCSVVQVFLKNSNQWKAKVLTDQDRSLFKEARAGSAVRIVIAHDSYLINLASPDRDMCRKSLDALVEELRRADSLGVPYLVVHPGAHMGAGETLGISRIARALNRALALVGPTVRILLENTAGQGSCLGHRFEHLAGILEKIRDPGRVGVCLDTCHMFAAGYDIRTEETYAETIRQFDRVVGIGHIAAFHVNDSKKGLGSRVDRHFHIGQGLIGPDAFRFLLNDRRFLRIPKILETPKGPGIEEDLMNLATLRSLYRTDPLPR
jgi:deoxyribonuclease IV